MKKYRTTRKDTMNTYDAVISIPYCALQSVLSVVGPAAYWCGVYGWNADIYTDYYNGKSVAIVTGYKTFGNIKPAYSFIKKFERAAQVAAEKYDAERAYMIRAELYAAFIKQLVK